MSIIVDSPRNTFEAAGCCRHPDRPVVAVLKYEYSFNDKHSSGQSNRLCRECLLMTQFMLSQFILKELKDG